VFGILLACVLLVAGLTSCAPYPQTDGAEPTSVTAAVCTDIMGLWSGEVYYPRCQESISYILAAKSKRLAMLSAYQDCKRIGLAEDEASFSSCVLSLMYKSAPAALVPIAAPTDPKTEPGMRFDYISLPVQLDRERYACAQLGLLPESGPFDDCVYSLTDALIPNKY